jgi:hypothetical protein
MDYFRQGIRMTPTSTELIYCLASSYKRLGKHQNALNWFMNGVALKPKWVDGLMGLTCTFFNLRNWQKTLHYCLLAKENYDRSNTQQLFSYDEILLIESTALKMTGNLPLASRKYKEEDKKIRGPL